VELAQANQLFVETPAQVIARTFNPTLGRQVFEKLDPKPADMEQALALYNSSIHATIVPNTNMLNFTIQGYSPEQTKAVLKGTAERLQEIHEEMSNAFKDPIKAELKFITKKVAESQASVQELQKVVGKRVGGNAEQILAQYFLRSEEREEMGLENRKKDLEDELAPPKTFPTHLFSEITVDPNPVAPNRKRFVIFALFAGIFGGIAIALGHYLIKGKRA
jgi:capsular polysaccharide biosynthesis protein